MYVVRAGVNSNERLLFLLAAGLSSAKCMAWRKTAKAVFVD